MGLGGVVAVAVVVVVGRSGNGGGGAKDDELSHSWPTVCWVRVSLGLYGFRKLRLGLVLKGLRWPSKKILVFTFWDNCNFGNHALLQN